MAVNDIYRVEIFQNVGSELTMNVLHVREVVSETVLTIPADAVIQMVTELYQALAPSLSEDWRVTQINARRVSPGPGIPSSLVFGGAEAIVGETVGEIVPSQAAVLISLYSSNGAPTGRGRQYIPGLASIDQNEGQLTETAWGVLDAAAGPQYTSAHGPFLGGDGEWRYTIHGGGVGPSSDQDVVSAVVRPNMATQRRRRNFPGFGS